MEAFLFLAFKKDNLRFILPVISPCLALSSHGRNGNIFSTKKTWLKALCHVGNFATIKVNN